MVTSWSARKLEGAAEGEEEEEEEEEEEKKEEEEEKEEKQYKEERPKLYSYFSHCGCIVFGPK